MTLRERIRELSASGKRAPKSLQREVVAYVEREERGGRRLDEVMEQLGVSRSRYRYWERKRGELVPAQFRPVLVRDAVAREGREGRELVVELGGVARVRGMQVADLAELLRALR